MRQQGNLRAQRILHVCRAPARVNCRPWLFGQTHRHRGKPFPVPSAAALAEDLELPASMVRLPTQSTVLVCFTGRTRIVWWGMCRSEALSKALKVAGTEGLVFDNSPVRLQLPATCPACVTCCRTRVSAGVRIQTADCWKHLCPAGARYHAGAVELRATRGASELPLAARRRAVNGASAGGCLSRTSHAGEPC